MLKLWNERFGFLVSEPTFYLGLDRRYIGGFWGELNTYVNLPASEIIVKYVAA
jgi:hypothetical protein